MVTLLPLCAILGLLTALNLELAVFEIMSGIRRGHPAEQVSDANYGFVLGLTVLSM